MEQSKIEAMMDGRTLTKENILNMYQMVQNASDAEEKKNVMKHSVFFVGQLPLKENHVVDVEKTERIVNVTVPLDELETYMQYLLDGLATQTLLLKKEDGSYEVNTKYENTVVKARKIARAYQLEQEKAKEESLPKAKKMYQMGTKYYHSGQYNRSRCLLFKRGGDGRLPDGLLQPRHDVYGRKGRGRFFKRGALLCPEGHRTGRRHRGTAGKRDS